MTAEKPSEAAGERIERLAELAINSLDYLCNEAKDEGASDAVEYLSQIQEAARATGLAEKEAALRLLETSLVPYKASDASPAKAYACSREAVQAVREALKGA